MSKLYEGNKAASGYNTSRSFPEKTVTLWKQIISDLVPAEGVSLVLDLGGGTGRFSLLLHELYGCNIITSDPSREMLNQGIHQNYDSVFWLQSVAENLPFKPETFDLVFMSQVYHHIDDFNKSFNDIYRILKPSGNLLIRNGTKESEYESPWFRFFPEAIEYDESRIPYRNDISSTLPEYGFKEIAKQPVPQIFALSYDEYYEKLARRGLSALIAISDEAFETGLIRFKEWTDKQPKNVPVCDPVDIFLFVKD